MEAGTDNLVETLSRLSLFADLPYPQIEALAHTFSEEVFAEGQRVIRAGHGRERLLRDPRRGGDGRDRRDRSAHG